MRDNCSMRQLIDHAGEPLIFEVQVVKIRQAA